MNKKKNTMSDKTIKELVNILHEWKKLWNNTSNKERRKGHLLSSGP